MNTMNAEQQKIVTDFESMPLEEQKAMLERGLSKEVSSAIGSRYFYPKENFVKEDGTTVNNLGKYTYLRKKNSEVLVTLVKQVQQKLKERGEKEYLTVTAKNRNFKILLAAEAKNTISNYNEEILPAIGYLTLLEEKEVSFCDDF